jgi:hypothetical protein
MLWHPQQTSYCFRRFEHLQDILLQFAVTFSFVAVKMRYFDGVQSGNKNTLYHLLSLLFHVFYGHLCYQNISISQKYILIAYIN